MYLLLSKSKKFPQQKRELAFQDSEKKIIITNNLHTTIHYVPCSLSDTNLPFLIFHCPSIFPVVEKAQHEPHIP